MKEKLKELLEKNGETAYSVAKDTGISETAISAYLRGEYEPKLGSLRKLAEHFDIPLTDLID